MIKEKLSKKEYNALIDEIICCNNALEKHFDSYIANTINRLIQARIDFSNSELQKKELKTTC